MSNKETWEHYGAENPYYGVATVDQFRDENLDNSNLDQFFDSGEKYIDEIWQEIETHFVSGFKPKSAMDLGCGVGRLAIPMAKRCVSVLGVDISSTMIGEAKKNAAERDVTNLSFTEINDDLANVSGKFDFVHSFIVLQHIDPRIGGRIIEQMVKSLNVGGIGALHLTYHVERSFLSSFTASAYNKLPVLYKLRNLLKGAANEPLIAMHPYDLNTVFRVLQENDCHRTYTRFTFHGLNGVLIFFQKKAGLLE